MKIQNQISVLIFLWVNYPYLVSSVEDELVPENSSSSPKTTDEVPKKYKQFLHVSDLHMDINYDEQKSCKKEYNGTNEDKPFGNFMCDSPEILVKSAIEYMKKQFPNPDFILWTGMCHIHINKNLIIHRYK